MNKKSHINIPDKLFGVDSGLILVFLPLVGLILLLVMIFNLVAVPKFTDLLETLKKIELAKAEIAQINAKKNYLLSINQEELVKNERFVSNSLLPEKNSYLLVNIVRKIADKYGFQLDSFLVKMGSVKEGEAGKVVGDGTAKVPVKLTLIGPTNRYLELVNGLERSLPILSIDTFSMSVIRDLVVLDLTLSSAYIESKLEVNPNKLSLAELTMTKTEADLLLRLSDEFTVVENLDMAEAMLKGQGYQKYSRKNPFSL